MARGVQGLGYQGYGSLTFDSTYCLPYSYFLGVVASSRWEPDAGPSYLLQVTGVR